MSPDPGARLTVVGDMEVVFDWSAQRCNDGNIPDLAARAYRDASGQVSLLLSAPHAYRMVGPNLNEVSMDCNALFTPAQFADPALFTDQEWLASVYTEDGQNFVGLVHNEYQGHSHTGQCPQDDYFLCWYNSITLVNSEDGGASFQHASEPPDHFVAGLPYPYEAGAGAYGLRAPSNIIQGRDDYYYVYMNYTGYYSDREQVCLMRSTDLSDPASWRFWDGAAFEGQFINPYSGAETGRSENICSPLAQDQIGHALNESIIYHPELDRYVLIGLSADQIDGREVWGFYYAFSYDLINWSQRHLLLEVPLPWTVEFPGSDLSYLYPSLLDPDSSDWNFATTDNQAYLYFTRNNQGHGSLDRDLVRVPVEFVFSP